MWLPYTSCVAPEQDGGTNVATIQLPFGSHTAPMWLPHSTHVAPIQLTCGCHTGWWGIPIWLRYSSYEAPMQLMCCPRGEKPPKWNSSLLDISLYFNIFVNLHQRKIHLSFVTLVPRPGFGSTIHLSFSPSSRRSNLICAVVVSLNVPSPLGSLTVVPRNVRQNNLEPQNHWRIS